MEDSVPVWTVVLVGAVLLAAGGLVPYVVARAAAGGLGRNRWVGVRTPATLSGDEPWRAGHAAARPWAAAAGGLLALAGLGALLVGATTGSAGVFATVVVGGAALAAVVLVAGAVRADAAARGPAHR
ncbi:SdpI family protein [Streptomyces sp. NP160]|uniref:SdpI family protein n=1 Tax=Streptomyces sp. NP160 TaxID=2586637 RepID=UPI0015D5D05D|nr:SdpI family protein [Streptomyces sp. NP160]